MMSPLSSISICCENVGETVALGRVLGDLLMPGSVVLLSGDLGAGKTQLTKGIAEVLGVSEPITSPTFNIMFEHTQTEGAVVLRHFDLYRLDEEAELDDIDYFGLLDDEVVSVVEWGDKFEEALPPDYLLVRFGYGGSAADTGSTRVLEFSAVGEASARVLQALEEKTRRKTAISSLQTGCNPMHEQSIGISLDDQASVRSLSDEA